MTYDITLPSDATVGTTYTFLGYDWVGRILDILDNPVENIIGYEDSQNTLQVIATALTTSTTTTDTTTICLSESIYGDDSEETELLRNFRDTILSSTPEGEEIIRLYYQWSPAIVKAMEEDEEFKEEMKEMIDGVLPLIRIEVE